MIVHKLRAGVLHVVSPYGLRCIRLTLSERIVLLWTFRHFKVLPEKVLTARAKRLLDELLNSDQPVERCNTIHPDDNDLIIGTLDRMEDQKKPAAGTRWKSSLPVTNSSRP
jgi:hypothetical protein